MVAASAPPAAVAIADNMPYSVRVSPLSAQKGPTMDPRNAPPNPKTNIKGIM